MFGFSTKQVIGIAFVAVVAVMAANWAQGQFAAAKK